MLGKSPNQKQKDLFVEFLKEIVNLGLELVILCDRIAWRLLKENFSICIPKSDSPPNFIPQKKTVSGSQKSKNHVKILIFVK